MIRTGIGFDTHRFVKGRKLVLGGVTIKHKAGLGGHSDADVLCHAIADALLGAIADGESSAPPPASAKVRTRGGGQGGGQGSLFGS